MLRHFVPHNDTVFVSADTIRQIAAGASPRPTILFFGNPVLEGVLQNNAARPITV